MAAVSLLRTAVDGWDDGSLPLATVVLLLRQSQTCDPPVFCLGSLLALRAVLRHQPQLQQGTDEGEYQLAQRVKQYTSLMEATVQELLRCKRSSSGDINRIAYYIIGSMYELTSGQRDEAMTWYRTAAEHGFALAQCALGYCYGKTKDNNTLRVVWYRLAAEQQLPVAQYNMGYCYQYGFGVIKDVIEAVRQYRLAAAQEWAPALYNLGCCYLCGIGVVQNEVEGVTWVRLAATRGHVEGQYTLGHCYVVGRGVAKDAVQAPQWFRMAAAQGSAKAQYELGVSYECGRGVQRNVVQALAWYQKAASQDHANAQAALRTVGGYDQRWFSQLHPYTPRACQVAAWTTLLAAGRFLVVLPNELWVEYIFPNWIREDFERLEYIY